MCLEVKHGITFLSYEKRQALQPKSEKCIFYRHSENVEGYRLIQTHSNEIIIKIYVKFDANILVCEPNSTLVPY